MEVKSGSKLYFVDTSVLLYDQSAVHAFVGNVVCLSMQVLDELDRFKTKPGIIGENARYVNRYLDGLRGRNGQGSLADGVYDDAHDISYRVIMPKRKGELDADLDDAIADNRIILDALRTSQDAPDSQVIVVTKDINMRVKCDSLGLTAEDYHRDRLDAEKFGEKDCVWTGQGAIEVEHDVVGALYAGESIDTNSELSPNSLLVVKSGTQSCLAVVAPCGTRYSKMPEVPSWVKITPYDKEQTYAINAMTNEKTPLVTLTGAPGSGKTFLTLLVGMEEINRGTYDRIVFTRSIQPVGKEIGFLPGDIDEKMAPWLGPIMDNFRHAYKDTTYFEAMIKKGKIDIAPLSFIRGRSFHNAFIIVDEAQNATIHELKTVITRVGEGSKLILMGDIDQIDTPYIDRHSNGLSIVVDKFRDSPMSAHIHLNRGRRSELANEANKLL